MSMGFSGEATPDTEGIDIEPTTLLVADDPRRITPLNQSTQAVILRADPNNSGIIYIGFSDDISINEGIPLQSGEVLSAEINVEQQPFYAVADTGGDRIYGLGSD